MRRRTCSDIEEAEEVCDGGSDAGNLWLFSENVVSSLLWLSGPDEAVPSLMCRREHEATEPDRAPKGDRKRLTVYNSRPDSPIEAS